MCTILTFDRFFYTQNKEEIHARIHADANSNDDGWAVVFMGSSPSQTVMMQSLELKSVMASINYIPWDRVFLHSRLSTTSTDGIFGCHNFTTVGNGLEENVEHGYWIVQHNGILKAPITREYLVDSMYIAEVIRSSGIDAGVKYMRDIEDYANVFLINPIIGQYRVVRSVTNSLYTDFLGNYSTNIVGQISKAVPKRSDYLHEHVFMKNKVPKKSPTYTVEEAIALWEREHQVQNEVLEDECARWGDEALNNYTTDIKQFAAALHFLSYLGSKKVRMPYWTFKSLTTLQQKWARTLGLLVKAEKTAK